MRIFKILLNWTPTQSLTVWHPLSLTPSTLPQTLFEQAPFIAVYNLFYTSQPVLALGVFDQDVNAYNSVKYPKLYYAGLKSSLFNKKEFFKSALQGFLTSCVLFFAAHGMSAVLPDSNPRKGRDQILQRSVAEP